MKIWLTEFFPYFNNVFESSTFPYKKEVETSSIPKRSAKQGEDVLCRDLGSLKITSLWRSYHYSIAHVSGKRTWMTEICSLTVSTSVGVPEWHSWNSFDVTPFLKGYYLASHGLRQDSGTRASTCHGKTNIHKYNKPDRLNNLLHSRM